MKYVLHIWFLLGNNPLRVSHFIRMCMWEKLKAYKDGFLASSFSLSLFNHLQLSHPSTYSIILYNIYIYICNIYSIIYIYIYISWSSYRKLTWVGFEPTIIYIYNIFNIKYSYTKGRKMRWYWAWQIKKKLKFLGDNKTFCWHFQ